MTKGKRDSSVKKGAGKKRKRWEVEGTNKIKGHCCLFESREKCLACGGEDHPPKGEAVGWREAALG